MDAESAKQLFDLYVQNSARILKAGFGVDRAESNMFDALELARSHPEIKPHVLRRIEHEMSLVAAGSLTEGDVPIELIELFAHQLKWSELMALAERRVESRFGGDRTYAASDAADRVVRAFRDHWEDREFYRRYKRSDDV